MVKHIILWKLKDEVVDKEAVKRGIKAGLEGLKGKIPGLVDVTVRIVGLGSSNADAMLEYAVMHGEVEEAERLRAKLRQLASMGDDGECKPVWNGQN